MSVLIAAHTPPCFSHLRASHWDQWTAIDAGAISREKLNAPQSEFIMTLTSSYARGGERERVAFHLFVYRVKVDAWQENERWKMIWCQTDLLTEG